MSHDTHHGHATEIKSKTSFINSFWLVVILVGLFIAALSFVKAESGGEEEGKGEGKEKTEMHATPPAGEKTEMKAEEPKPAENAAVKEEAPEAKK